MRLPSSRQLALGQGLFYLAAGLWPVIDRKSFERVTGPKKDFWLEKALGLLMASTGLTLAIAGRRGRVEPEEMLLGAATAGSLGTISGYYALRRRIPRIYLLDALTEATLVTLWAAAARRGSPVGNRGS